MSEEIRKYEPHSWEIVETDFSEEGNLQSETIFSLGNGKIGLRGSFEEGFYGEPENSIVGTYLNGIYEYREYQYAWKRPGFPDRTHAMINVANILPVEVFVEGEKVIMTPESAKDYKRILDMKHGVLRRSFVWTGRQGKQVQIETERFVSLDSLNLIAMKYEVRPLNFTGDICIASVIDGNAGNNAGRKPEMGALKKAPTYIQESAAGESGCYIVQKTYKSGFVIGSVMENDLQNAVVKQEEYLCDERYVKEQFTVSAEQEKSIILYKYIGLDAGTELDINALVAETHESYMCGYEELKRRQEKCWKEFWENADVWIDGDDALQQAVRYDAFQLMQGTGKDGKTNIGANALTGEGYRGQTFWDTEMYMLPFFLYTQPEVAKQLLIYRHHILPKAKERARQMEGCGALYAWNSINGEECGFVFEAATAQYHINPDICYAIKRYMDATQDEEFMIQYGAEMLFETSKYMAHRGCFIKYRNNQFCINVVCGPDEYTPIVDNNYYTNYMTKVQLDFAYDTAKWLKEKYPQEYDRLIHKTEIDEEEIELWKRAADNMYLPYSEELDMPMQDDQTLYREPVDIKTIDKERLPLLFHLHPLNLWRYQILKQADIVLLMYIMSQDFSRETKEKIYDFYEPKTIHDSSLSVSIHSIVANDIGRYDEAYEYFMKAARMDLDDRHGNTCEGVHAACMGGTILAILNGFAGMRIYDGCVHFEPHIPEKWKQYKFRVVYRGRTLEVHADHTETSYTLLDGENMEIEHCGQRILLEKGAPKVMKLN